MCLMTKEVRSASVHVMRFRVRELDDGALKARSRQRRHRRLRSGRAACQRAASSAGVMYRPERKLWEPLC